MNGLEIAGVLALFLAIRFIVPVLLVFSLGTLLKRTPTA